jgi:hypothetical protein
VLAAFAVCQSAGAQDWQAASALNRPGQPTDDSFGWSVGISGKSMIVGAQAESGAQQRSGAAYVFEGDQWASVTRLTAGEETAFGGFGYAVALEGDTAFVGTDRLEKSPVYIFGKSGGSWALTQTLREDSSDTFGDEIRVRGNVAMLAAPKDSADIGKIHVYGKAGATWTEQQELTANDGASGDFFALSLDFDGENVIVGEPATNSASPHPAAYIFTKTGTGFSQQAKLDLDKTGVVVGSAVAISGDTAVVGTPPAAGNMGNGRVSIYARSGVTWAAQQVLTVPSEERFGSLVQVQGDTLFVTAETGGQCSLYVFRRTGAVWAQTQKLPAPPAMYGPNALAVNGGTLAIGNPDDKLTGAVQVYRDPAEDSVVSAETDHNGKSSGCALSSSASSRGGLAPWAVLGAALLLFGKRRARVVRRNRNARG